MVLGIFWKLEKLVRFLFVEFDTIKLLCTRILVFVTNFVLANYFFIYFRLK